FDDMGACFPLPNQNIMPHARMPFRGKFARETSGGPAETRGSGERFTAEWLAQVNGSTNGLRRTGIERQVYPLRGCWSGRKKSCDLAQMLARPVLGRGGISATFA